LSLITVPKKIYVKSVASEGETELNAFDNCLIKAGLPQVSLIKVTSILPADIELVNEPPSLPIGCNVPAIYAYIVSCNRNEKIAGAMALGWTDVGPTLVAEYAERNIDKREAEKRALIRLEGMAKARGLKITKKIVVSEEHVVEKCGCVLVIAVEVE